MKSESDAILYDSGLNDGIRWNQFLKVYIFSIIKAHIHIHKIKMHAFLFHLSCVNRL